MVKRLFFQFHKLPRKLRRPVIRPVRSLVLRRKLWEHPILFEIRKRLESSGYTAEYMVKFDSAGSFYRLDYAHPILKICVEVDGPYHRIGAEPARDRRRDERLTQLGWAIYRVPVPRAGRFRPLKEYLQFLPPDAQA